MEPKRVSDPQGEPNTLWGVSRGHISQGNEPSPGRDKGGGLTLDQGPNGACAEW